jgi:transcriptional regulator with XRE-family HTH domain
MVLDQRHLNHQQLASQLGVSPSYWSLLFNNHRSLTPRLRRRLLRCPALRELSEDELWEIRADGEHS